jgi:hypothetical protein
MEAILYENDFNYAETEAYPRWEAPYFMQGGIEDG